MGIKTKIQMLPGLARFAGALLIAGTLAACSPLGMFARDNVEPLVPAEQLYASAVANMDNNRFNAAIEDLEKLEKQHPFSEVNERGKVMLTFANFRQGRFPDAVRAADRYLALYPNGAEADYVLFLKGSSYYRQIADITRDQELAAEAIDTFALLESRFPNSRYVAESRQMVLVARDQVAGKEMSVGRYYLGNRNYTAAINRFRTVVEDHQTSTHVEEALYRLIEGYLALGLVGEAQTAGAVLGTNYPNSDWYQRGFTLLQNQGLAPQMMTGNWMST
ncbi:outer membrane protein assembly factor BamD [Pelagibacterium lacus]|uniref:Outer membrane protein assembly factor BamD n=1 Tax=Pelagibacterium lacus TaxID=2282655 RepID=A0A369W344_9HYPH|nr:outer membrane protein assembly factor BamD [Pelagibacterium lacus]RDE09094.1 outer membrane protein assembly factor BamD [Pelagibacterium lacus]